MWYCNRCLLSVLLLVITPTLAYAQNPPEPLQPYHWENRLLLIFAPSPANADYQIQAEALADQQVALQERQIKLFKLFVNDKPDLYAEQLTEVTGSLTREQEVLLRQHYDIDVPPFALILIGKDGTEKFRHLAPVAPEVLYEIIDTMPMRQRELEQEDAQKN